MVNQVHKVAQVNLDHLDRLVLQDPRVLQEPEEIMDSKGHLDREVHLVNLEFQDLRVELGQQDLLVLEETMDQQDNLVIQVKMILI